MALDTANKRRSVQGYTLTPIAPIPDGSIDAFDRAQMAWLYSGIESAPPAPVAIPLTRQQQALLRAAQRIHNAFGFGAKQALVFDTYQIRRTAMSSDGMGGTIPGAVQVVATFQGALMAQGANAQEREMLAQLTAAGGYILHAPLGADIRASDQLVSASGRTFEVRGAPLRGMPAVNLLVAVEELL